MKNPKSILITGASSGIGEALAEHYAAPGVALALSGRNPQRVEAVAQSCRDKGADARGKVIDVADPAAMEAWLAEVDGHAPLDLVIANAGIGLRTSDVASFAELTERTFAVNVHGVFNTIHPALELMKPRRRGQIALMSSVAGFVGMPGAVAYGASKAAVRSYGEGLRGGSARHGIEVNVICPGFVVSRMTADNRFRMPGILDADKAAGIIARGLEQDKGRIAFPRKTYWSIRLLQILPAPLAEWVTRRSPSKDDGH